jgi:hypothetical protein
MCRRVWGVVYFRLGQQKKMSQNSELAIKYLSVLQQYDLAAIYGGSHEYSGIFLSSASGKYLQSNIKTMIVGKETRGWLDDSCAGKLRHKFESAEVDASIKKPVEYLIVNSPKSNKSKFIQFYRKLCRELNGEKKLGESIIWSNLFCISHNKKSPVGSKSFVHVKALSKQLLLAQIEILKPQVILFVTGTSYDKYIKEFFPEMTESIVKVPRKLWSLKLVTLNVSELAIHSGAMGRNTERQPYL